MRDRHPREIRGGGTSLGSAFSFCRCPRIPFSMEGAMLCLEQPARLAQDHAVSHRHGLGDTPSHTQNSAPCPKVGMLPPGSTQGFRRQRPYPLQEADPPDRQEHRAVRLLQPGTNRRQRADHRRPRTGRRRQALRPAGGADRKVVPPLPRPRSGRMSLPTTAWRRRPAGTARSWRSSCRP